MPQGPFAGPYITATAHSMQRQMDTLYEACEQGLNAGAVQQVQFFLRQGANVNAVCSDGNTPIHAAVASGSVAVLREVTALGLGADLNSRNERGMTPLHVAMDMAAEHNDRSYAPVVQHLLSCGADFTLSNETGGTALQLAAEYQLFDVVESFLNHPREAELTAAALSAAALSATQAYIDDPTDVPEAHEGAGSDTDSDGESPAPSEEGDQGPGDQAATAEHLLARQLSHLCTQQPCTKTQQRQSAW